MRKRNETTYIYVPIGLRCKFLPKYYYVIITSLYYRVDLNKRHVEWDFSLDRLMFLGKYKVSGRVLILPITGSGDANITLSKYLAVQLPFSTN